MKTKLILLSMTIMFVFSTCKKGDTGPQGPAGPTGGTITLHQGGFISGTISGNRSDGTPYSISFNYPYYWDADNFSFNISVPEYYFRQYRYPSSDPYVQGYIDLYYNLFPLTSIAPYNATFHAHFLKDLGNNQIFNLLVDAYSSSSSITIYNFSYISSTRIAKGDFVIAVDPSDNSTGNPATITGSFQTVAMTEYLSRKGN